MKQKILCHWKPERSINVPLVLLLAALLCLLVACSSGISAQTTTATSTAVKATPTPTVPAIPKGTILFKADWSHGLKGWQSAGGWQIVHGYLQGNSIAESSLIFPYKSTVINYAIDVRLQAERILQKGARFGIFAQKTARDDGYDAGISSMLKLDPYPGTTEGQVLLEPAVPASGNQPMMSTPIDYAPGTIWHDYRVEVQDGRISFYDNGSLVGAVESISDEASNGPLGLVSTRLLLRVSNITITAL